MNEYWRFSAVVLGDVGLAPWLVVLLLPTAATLGCIGPDSDGGAD